MELLDVTGPAEVFSVASRVLGGDQRGYQVRIATADGGELPTASGIRLLADLALDEVDDRVDTLLVAGAIDLADGAVEPVVDAQVTAWLRGPRRGPVGRVRSARAPTSWPRQGCSTADAPRRTG